MSHLFKKKILKSPQYDILKVFGFACFPYLKAYNSNKMQFRSKCCVFLGYSLNQQSYRSLHLTTGRVFLSRHVVFDETIFHIKNPSLLSPSPYLLPRLTPS